MTLPKRTVDEWVTLAKIASDLRNVFCEGPTDVALIKAASGFPRNTDFRCADQIQFDPEPHIFDGGNKLRVKKVAEAALLAEVSNVRCLVDRDFQIFYEAEEFGDVLVLTDGSNIISSLISFDFVRQYLVTGYNSELSLKSWNTLVLDLRFCFLCRFVNQRDQMGCAPPLIHDHLEAAGNGVGLNRRSYLQGFFGLQGLPANEFMEMIEDIEGPSEDFRFYIHSSDLINYLFGCLREQSAIPRRDSVDTIKHSVLASLPCDLNGGENLMMIARWATHGE